MTTKSQKRDATLLMTGHSLTLLIGRNPVAGANHTKRSIAALKEYISARKGTLTFTEDNLITFPWLRDLI